MKEYIDNHIKQGRLPLIIAGVILAVIIIAGSFVFLFQTVMVFRNDSLGYFKILNQRIAILEEGLATTTLKSKELSQQLLEQQSQTNYFQTAISQTVGTLEKLSKTDKELLQKYSKVYFLSDNYVPLSLTNISEKYLFDSTKIFQFHTSALSYLEGMLYAANLDKVSLKIVSAYRSFGTQSTLKDSYLVTYGSGANKFSADQGYSEHQLGTAVDLTTEGLEPSLSTKLEDTPAYQWLNENAYKYGFILSYPKGNAFYQYEPWHWRFVGINLARKLNNDGINFSDMEQRGIDTYLANIFE